MSIRTILTHFTDDPATAAVRMALAAATDLQAHVVGLYVEAPASRTPTPTYAVDAAGLGAGSFGMSGVRAQIATGPDPIVEATRRRDQQASTAKAGFRILCRERSIEFLDEDERDLWHDHPLPSASFRHESGTLLQAIDAHAHAYDMLVMESATVSKQPKSARSAIETALMRSRRPVLLAPSAPPEHLNGHALVAWNDSPECWHALSAALPFLKLAADVTLFHAGSGHDGKLAEERAAEYLAWHGIAADLMQHEPDGANVADYLMSECGRQDVGLMVMGAYSHSPLREKLLGGVTLTMLSNSAATPVLMMH